MKEKLLVLAKAAPIVSKKYEQLVCVARITETGEWRRIYPIPWKYFWKTSPHHFSKKQWIEYELRDKTPSDHRSESRKIKPETIKTIRTAKFKEIIELIKPKITNLSELEKKDHRKVSLGIIKPKIRDFYEMTNKQFEKWSQQSKQKTLSNQSAQPLEIPQKKYGYRFLGQDNKKHELLCEDWEIVELYRHCESYRKKGTYKDKQEVFEKIKQKMLGELPNKKDLFFVVGTHYRFPTYIIIGIVYPKKADQY
ncbi:hypothetical protein KKE06_03920 [Candidatus Micrarchaeota archaeon]|nr:hypothetical protein [Candidatus Micrarchaeota archaeon]MBU1930394.1 hypothetical protein [Candidatus Micrarchaeota archaeon]